MKLCVFCRGAGNLVAFVFDKITYRDCPFCDGAGVNKKGG